MTRCGSRGRGRAAGAHARSWEVGAAGGRQKGWGKCVDVRGRAHACAARAGVHGNTCVHTSNAPGCGCLCLRCLGLAWVAVSHTVAGDVAGAGTGTKYGAPRTWC